jgi:sugar/nucleoside kinase (ribokinase family)
MGAQDASTSSPRDFSVAQEASSDDRLDVVVMGSALVDVLARASDDHVAALGLTKGTMTLVDLPEATRIYDQMGPASEISGGSAANTAFGVAMLGGRAGFVGKVAEDTLGSVFVHDLSAAGVEVGRLASVSANQMQAGADGPVGMGGARSHEDRATGMCLVLVTEDGERTMATHLGVAGTLGLQDLDEDLVARAEVLYLEGYLWDVEEAKAAMRRAIAIAHGADALVAFSASDPFCVRRHQREFLDLLRDDLDVFFANEEEARLLFGRSDIDQVIEALSETGTLAAVTRGSLGSVVVASGGSTLVPAAPVEKVVDTTGAGDLYAAGFLYGLTHGQPPENCGYLGGLCAAEVISHVGAHPETDLTSLVS